MPVLGHSLSLGGNTTRTVREDTTTGDLESWKHGLSGCQRRMVSNLKESTTGT
jgi:hypothetical protein